MKKRVPSVQFVYGEVIEKNKMSETRNRVEDATGIPCGMLRSDQPAAPLFLWQSFAHPRCRRTAAPADRERLHGLRRVRVRFTCFTLPTKSLMIRNFVSGFRPLPHAKVRIDFLPLFRPHPETRCSLRSRNSPNVQLSSRSTRCVPYWISGLS